MSRLEIQKTPILPCLSRLYAWNAPNRLSGRRVFLSFLKIRSDYVACGLPAVISLLLHVHGLQPSQSPGFTGLVHMFTGCHFSCTRVENCKIPYLTETSVPGAGAGGSHVS